MRILILGNNYSAESFYNNFCLDKNNIVFSTCSNTANFVKYDSEDDIVDFIEANEINFVLTKLRTRLVSDFCETKLVDFDNALLKLMRS